MPPRHDARLVEFGVALVVVARLWVACRSRYQLFCWWHNWNTCSLRNCFDDELVGPAALVCGKFEEIIKVFRSRLVDLLVQGGHVFLLVEALEAIVVLRVFHVRDGCNSKLACFSLCTLCVGGELASISVAVNEGFEKAISISSCINLSPSKLPSFVNGGRLLRKRLADVAVAFVLAVLRLFALVLLGRIQQRRGHRCLRNLSHPTVVTSFAAIVVATASLLARRLLLLFGVGAWGVVRAPLSARRS